MTDFILILNPDKKLKELFIAHQARQGFNETARHALRGASVRSTRNSRLNFQSRISIRPWKPEDAASVARFADNPRIAENLRDAFPTPYGLDDAREFIASCLANEGKRQLTRAIELDGAAAGSVGVFVGSDVYRRSAELGYWLGEDYWGRGVMTRAVRQICREAFEKFDVVRIFAEPFERNAASRGVLEKAGFTLEGVMRAGVFKNGAVQSYCMYSLLRGELEERQ